MRGGPRERRRFPSNVFRYADAGRRVLYDTGYAPSPWRTGLAGRIYRRLLPPVIDPGETIAAQLDPTDVTHVVLSHLHPDHIGGLVHFPHATLVLHPALLTTLAHPRLTDGVLAGLLPDWFDRARRIVVGEFGPGPFGLATHDLFGDDSYHLVDLPGHARGHLGALVAGHALARRRRRLGPGPPRPGGSDARRAAPDHCRRRRASAYRKATARGRAPGRPPAALP
ncbi:MBL fold metallo-hydrolase [Occultella kanbiaonis]|uniref:MBL fold metallo-hydrolase n=1 Tax=Occultella kanbiaonis TaxID=2675754 RepID=UPI0013D649E0|nr:MBL fold metallo-hydrolase [Occultella kanbiaonis]